MKLLDSLRVFVRADASGFIAGLNKAHEMMLDYMMRFHYHDDLCGMNDDTEWEVFV